MSTEQISRTTGKYFWLERDFGDEDKAEESTKTGKGKKSEREATPIPDSSLDAEVQDLCRLIFNTACVHLLLPFHHFPPNLTYVSASSTRISPP